MQNWFGDLICSARQFLDQGFRSLPTILAGAILILGLIQGNLNFLFFFVGLFIVAPLGALLANGAFEFLAINVPSWLPESIGAFVRIPESLWMVPQGAAEQCSMFTPFPSSGVPGAINTVPSYWMTIMAFFFFYLFANAYSLYTRQSDEKAAPQAVQARRQQAIVGMTMIGILGATVTVLRYARTGCETGLGVLASIVVGGALGTGWHTFMQSCGMGRLDDIFGITNRILPMQSFEDETPVTCVPSKD
jgi:hypothetical protein